MDPLLGTGPPLPEEGPSSSFSIVLLREDAKHLLTSFSIQFFNPDYLPTVGVSPLQDGVFF